MTDKDTDRVKTLKLAQKVVRPLGLVLRRHEGELQLKPFGEPWDGPLTYFPTDYMDAVATARKFDNPPHRKTWTYPGEGNLYQCGISVDTEDARAYVTKCLGWEFVDRIDDGVWNVRTRHAIPVGHSFTVELPTDEETLDGRILLNIEWP